MNEECRPYHKLVRDRIPEIIRREGRYPSIGRLDPAEMEAHLKFKLIEECHELFRVESDSELVDEACDIVEILKALVRLRSIQWDRVEQQRRQKREDRGGFDKRVYLYQVRSSSASRSQDSDQDKEITGPRLLTRESDHTLLETIKEELEEAERFNIASAFYSRGMHNLLIRPLQDFAGRGGKIRLLTSIMNYFNHPADLMLIQELVPELELRIFYPPGRGKERDFSVDPPAFHLKCYLFEKQGGDNSLIIGSSNLTAGGLYRNYEWNYFSNSEVNIPLGARYSAFQNGITEFDGYWQGDSLTFEGAFRENYCRRFDQASRHRRNLSEALWALSNEEPKPRTAQKEALAELADARAKGNSKTAVVAATGLGKTFLAAFDFRQSEMTHLLFLAHRENILRNAQGTFRNVLKDSDFGCVLSGDTADSAWRELAKGGKSVFAMVQTLSRASRYKSLAKDYFDYVVIDEFHHAEAASYRKILAWFRPKFLLGLTATPERMDGRDVLKHCDGNVAYEMRLFDAIENRWLVPFQYYAVYDETDYSQLRWTSRGYVESELDELLQDDTRAELVAANLARFLPSAGKMKALAFCSSRVHARYMSRKFNELGYLSVCILGDVPEEQREEFISRLEDEEDGLNIICSVDVFSEGVDIPPLSHVLFLRPTQSFTVFLQQLGRGLRLAAEKEFLVVLDFVGNFRQSYVAPLALRGYRSLEQFRGDRLRNQKTKLPAGCHLDPDTDVERIWNEEIRRVMRTTTRKGALTELYREMTSMLGRSPSLMDFYVNPAACDPQEFIRQFGGWLRMKETMGDLESGEKELLDTPGEAFLLHLEKDLHPAKSYKMVTLSCLLSAGSTRNEWSPAEIARLFKGYYLEHPEHLYDYLEMARHPEPEKFPVSKVVSHIKRNPLNFLSNTEDKFFDMDLERDQFRLKPSVHAYWRDSVFRDLVRDRVEYCLKRYFYRKRITDDQVRGKKME